MVALNFQYPLIDTQSMKLSINGLINNTKNILEKYKNICKGNKLLSFVEKHRNKEKYLNRELYIITRQLAVLCNSFDWWYSCNIEEAPSIESEYYLYENATTILELKDDSYIELVLEKFYIDDDYMGLGILIKSYLWNSEQQQYLYDTCIQTHGFGFGESDNPIEELLIEKINDIFHKNIVMNL